MKYFAYGSNMSLPRLRARAPSADRLGVFALAEHSLRFHKVGKDGSGKCDALFTGNANDYVIGALFEMSDHEKCALDRAESLGYGYQDKTVSVVDAHGNGFEALTYYAIITDTALQPYSWYLHHTVYGARESGLPTDYLDALAGTVAIEDPDIHRDTRERAVYS